MQEHDNSVHRMKLIPVQLLFTQSDGHWKKKTNKQINDEAK